MSELSLYDVVSAAGGRYDVYYNYLAQKTMKQKTPLSAILELSPVCNFNCQMCYVRKTEQEIRMTHQHVMRFDEWKYYLDGLSELGIINFTLTGGEATLHPDFLEIYKYLYNLGKQVIVMTNGSCLTSEILDLFELMPPEKIYITLYGMSDTTYANTCRNAAYSVVTSNIKKIQDRKLPLVLQYTCCKGNIGDLYNAYNYAKSIGLPLPFADGLLSFNECTGEKLNQSQVDEEEFRHISRQVYCNMHGITEEEYERRVYEEQITIPKTVNPKKQGIPCNAGRNSCAINWEGYMRPCNGMDAFSVDPRTNGGISKTWNELTDWADNVPRIVECQTCIFRGKCKPCFALHYNDTHEYGKPSPRFCYKQTHPKEASFIEDYYHEHGELPPFELVRG